MVVSAHCAVVQHNRRDRVTRPHSSLDVQAGHAESCVAHDVHAELGRVSDLSADHQGDAVPEVGSLTPADVAERNGCRVKRHNLVTWMAGVVGRHGVLVVHDCVDFGDNPVRVHRRACGRQFRRPLSFPLRPHGGDSVCRSGVPPTAIVTDRSLDLFDHGLQHQLGVTDNA